MPECIRGFFYFLKLINTKNTCILFRVQNQNTGLIITKKIKDNSQKSKSQISVFTIPNPNILQINVKALK